MKTKKKVSKPRHVNKKTHSKRRSSTTSKSDIQKRIMFAPSQIRNISIELKDRHDIKYSWKVEKSSKETIFYNYPVDLLKECLEKINGVINQIASKERIHIDNKGNVPERILYKFNELLAFIYTYTLIGTDGLRSEYAGQKLHEFPYNKYNRHLSGTKSTRLLMHRFVNQAITLNYYYINNVYELLPIIYDPKFKILNICHHMGYAEACIYKYINKTDLEQLNSNIDTQLVSFVFGNKFRDNELLSMKQIYKYTNYKLISTIWSPEQINEIINVQQSSKDLCYLDTHMFLNNYQLIRINYNHQLLLGGLIIALCSLKQNGKLLLSLAGLSSKFCQDLIFIVNQYFDRMVLFKTELYKPHYNTYFIACYGFRNKVLDNFTNDITHMMTIYKEMYNVDKTGGLEYIPNDPKVEQELGIKHAKRINGGKYTYFNSLLDGNHDSLIYDLISQHIEQRLQDYIEFLGSAGFYYDNIVRDKKLHQQLQLQNYYKCIKMANYLNLKINPVIDIHHLQTDIATDIYQNLYGMDTTIYYQFRMYPGGKIVYTEPKLAKSNQYLQEQTLRMDNATRIFDTRRIEDYDALKKKLRFYEKTLNKLLMERYNTGIVFKNGQRITHPSRAWIKMYEIAEITKLIQEPSSRASNKKYKVLCFCEAPGNFILAINHYIKTKTNITDFEWVAQSYNPNTKEGRDYHVLGDDYDLMKKYPDNWDFGPKNTGDITDSDNIKYYGSVYNDVDLITADCGTDWGGDDMLSSKLMYGQLLFILNNLPAGKNFVIKYYIPFIHYPAQMALFYIIYESFGEISFYKPLQNAWSHEFYLIGKDYKGVSAGLLNQLFYILDNYNPYLTPIALNKIPDTFYKQLEKVSRDIVDRFVFYIERYIYYLDIIEEGKHPDFETVEDHINIRNEEWIKTFKIEKIKTSDKI